MDSRPTIDDIQAIESLTVAICGSFHVVSLYISQLTNTTKQIKYLVTPTYTTSTHLTQPTFPFPNYRQHHVTVVLNRVVCYTNTLPPLSWHPQIHAPRPVNLPCDHGKSSWTWGAAFLVKCGTARSRERGVAPRCSKPRPHKRGQRYKGPFFVPRFPASQV